MTLLEIQNSRTLLFQPKYEGKFVYAYVYECLLQKR